MSTYRRVSKTKWKKLREPAKLRKIRKASQGKLIRIREAELKALIREGAHAGLVAAIEHTHNFWQISDGYKKYIEHEIASQAEALKLAVKATLRVVLREVLREVLAERPRRKP